MRQTGTDYQRIRSLLDDCFETGYALGRDGAGETFARRQKDLTLSAKLMELFDFLDIDFENGNIVNIAGKEIGGIYEQLA